MNTALSLSKMFMFISVLLILLFANVVHAAITQRGSATTNSGGSTLTINKPTGVVAGDIMIANLGYFDSTTDASSSGWTLIDGSDVSSNSGRHGAVLYKVAGASEPASYAFSTGAGTTLGAIVAFTGVDPTTPFDVSLTGVTISHADANTISTVTAITTASSNAAVIMFGIYVNSSVGTWSGWSTTSPGSLTELYDVTGGGIASVGAAWALKPTAGTTGAGHAQNSAARTAGGIGGILVALRPAPVRRIQIL